MIIEIMVLVVTLILLAYTGFVTDTEKGGMKIKNWVVALVLLIGLSYHLANHNIMMALQGVLYGGIPLMFLYLGGLVGAGDVKLFAALGAVFGHDVFLVLLLTYIVLLVYVLYALLSTGSFFSNLRREFMMLGHYLLYVFLLIKGDFTRAKEIHLIITGSSKQLLRVPMGGFIFCGATAVSGLYCLTFIR